MHIIDPQLDNYLHQITPAHHEILKEMEDLAAVRRFPIVGPLVGRVLFQYAKLLKPRRILELGSGYGYSALWWSLASDEGAEILCTEGSRENISEAERLLTRAGVWQKTKFYEGDALQTIDKLEGEFDVIFMDIDKHQYPEGFRKGFPRLRHGGLFITDNVLWSGKVIEKPQDHSTAAIVRYNELIYSTPGAFSTILPLRDGVAITYKE